MNSHLQFAEAIASYLTDMKSPQAVLIDGEWGVGKSYFVRETLASHLERKGLSVIFYSLYGVDSLDSIREDLIYAIIQKKNQFYKNKKQKNAKVPFHKDTSIN